MRRIHDDIVQLDLRTDQIKQMFSRGGTKQNIHICHAQIRIDDEDALPPFAQCNCKVDGNVCLADAPFAARNRDHTHIRPCLRLCRCDGSLRALCADHLAQPRCLIFHIIPSKEARQGVLPSQG